MRNTPLQIWVIKDELKGADSLTLRYGASQEWNSGDCYKFARSGSTFEWFCQFECAGVTGTSSAVGARKTG